MKLEANSAAFPPGPLHGIVPPMVTPLSGRDTLDVPGLERLIEHVLAGGVHGLFILGTSGEGASLGDKVCRELVQRTCRQVAGRAPVLVGVTDTRVGDSIALGRWAADAGAAAVVVSTPYYLPLEQQELVSYVDAVVAEQPLPVFLYNIPGLTKTAYEPDTVVRLSESPRVVGVKDSSGDLNYLRNLRSRVGRKDWSFFVGTESQMADAVAAGCHGCVGGGANLDPRTFVALYDAAVRRDVATVAVLQERLRKLDRIYRLGTGTASIMRGLKCALSCLGICNDRMTDPMRSCTEAERRVIRGYLAELSLSAPSAKSSTNGSHSSTHPWDSKESQTPKAVAARVSHV